MSNSFDALRLWATNTIPTVINVHRGAALPAARVVVLLVPTAAALVYLWLRRRRGPDQ